MKEAGSLPTSGDKSKDIFFAQAGLGAALGATPAAPSVLLAGAGLADEGASGSLGGLALMMGDLISPC